MGSGGVNGAAMPWSESSGKESGQRSDKEASGGTKTRNSERKEKERD